MTDQMLQDRQGGVEVGFREIERQLERESGMITRGVERYRKKLEQALKDGREDQMLVGIRFLWEIMSCLEPAVENLQNLAIQKLGDDGKIEDWVPLVCIDKTRLAYLTARCVFAHRHDADPYDEGDDPTVRQVLSLAIAVGEQIVRERKYDVWGNNHLSRPLREVHKEVKAWVDENVTRVRGHLKRIRKIRKAVKALGTDGLFVDLQPEDGPVHAAVRLLEVLVNSCPTYFECPESNKSFVLVERQEHGFPAQRVVLTEYAQQMLEQQHHDMAQPLLQPMLCPPRPWREDPKPKSKGYVGGYYSLDDKRLISGKKYRKHTRDLEHPVGPETLSAVNAVQATKWRINHRVAEKLCLVAESEHRERLGLGPTDKIRQTRRCTYAVRQAMSSLERTEYYRKRREIAKKNSHRQITLRLLEEEKDQKSIWFPHFLDYRGRMYPYPQNLHPQASDRVRACLEFAEGKPLGPEGENWIRMQLPASYGGDVGRLSLKEQTDWVYENEKLILRLATPDRLDEIEFWKDAKAPWRFLAVCCEWARLRDHCNHHGRSSEFLSHLPVTMDGRCNGIQHLAALAGDPELGKLVHITPSSGDASLDIYQVIADKLRDIVKRDAAEGKAEASAWLQRNDLISRDTVKPAVMTFPFGASQRGLIKQILEGDAVYRIPGGDAWRDACYLAVAITQITNSEEGEILSPAKAIMTWLSGVARDFARAKTPIIWTNPAGMNICLANFHCKSKEIDLHGCFNRKISITYRSEDRERGLDTQKQGQGITASLVHSFDAAHLAKTVNACVAEGVDSFAVIHDSYGTHACDATTMARLLREQFVEIHSQPWLKQLAERWQRKAETLPGVKVSDPPEQGNLDISQVIKSETFFC